MSYSIPNNHEELPHNRGLSIFNGLLSIVGFLTGSLWTLFIGISISYQASQLGSRPVLTSPQGFSSLLPFLPTIPIVILMILLLLAGRWALRARLSIWRNIKTFALSVIIGAILSILFPLLLMFAAFDTEYAPGYSERAFRSISLENTEQQVVARLGQPISFIDTSHFDFEDGTQKILTYSRSPSSTHYHLRRIWLDGEGNITRIQREIYWD